MNAFGGANDGNATRIRLHGRRILPSRAPSNHVGLETLAPKHRNDHPEDHVEIAREQTDTPLLDCIAESMKKIVRTGADISWYLASNTCHESIHLRPAARPDGVLYFSRRPYEI